MNDTLVAIDLGATSGRVIAGRVSSQTIAYSVIHRFSNGPIAKKGSLQWNASGLFGEILEGLTRLCVAYPGIASLGVDSWAVDYGLLQGGELLSEPFHYRDPRTAKGVEAVHRLTPFEVLFERNGLQFLTFNTIYQLAAEDWSGAAGRATSLLLMPDLINYWLTGAAGLELTNASTMGLLSARSGELDRELIALSGASPSLFAAIHEPGFRLGGFEASVAARLGCSAEVVAVASHDTASAVVAAPLGSSESAYISCGTWGLVGVETEKPILSVAAREANFTNEIGLDRRFRFLHNVMGLWLLNESVNHWNTQGERCELKELVHSLEDYDGPVGVFDVNDPVFMAPGDMPARIRSWLADHGDFVPEGPAQTVASIIESLAVAFATAVHTAGRLSGITVREINIVGGGSQNAVLCQRLANRAGIPVVAGPVEATAVGNLLVQARTQGFITGDLDSMRGLVRKAFPLVTYSPSPGKEKKF